MCDDKPQRVEHARVLPKDDTQMTLLVGTKDGCIVVEFPKQIKWIALTAERAEGLIQLLQTSITKLREAEAAALADPSKN